MTRCPVHRAPALQQQLSGSLQVRTPDDEEEMEVEASDTAGAAMESRADAALTPGALSRDAPMDNDADVAHYAGVSGPSSSR